MTADPISECIKCGGPVKRLIGAGAGIIFKGSGFYTTDYKKSSAATSSSEKSASTSSSEKKESGSSGSDTKSKNSSNPSKTDSGKSS
jgi:predicted nucleic acid-binding Zn ribbon protein